MFVEVYVECLCVSSNGLFSNAFGDLDIKFYYVSKGIEKRIYKDQLRETNILMLLIYTSFLLL